MCDQHCNVCDKGFTESCRLLTCPAYSPAVEVRGVSPIAALQAFVKDADREAFDRNCFPSMATWSTVVEMIGALDNPSDEAVRRPVPAPVARKTEGNVVAFKPRGG